MRKTLREIHWSLLVFIALMLYAQSALADVRTEARKHFRAGMELISGGQLDEGAAELAGDELRHRRGQAVLA